jgi:hypothetical protein
MRVKNWIMETFWRSMSAMMIGSGQDVGILYRKVDGGYGGSVSQEDQWLGNSGWRVSNWSLVDPQTRMPLKLLKKPLANFYNGYFRNFFGELERELAGNGGDMKRNLRAIPQ